MSSPISFIRAIVVLVTLLAFSNAQHVANSKCAKGVHLVVTSGYGGSPTGYGGILSELVADILKKIPHSTAVSVPFDKGNTADYRGSISGASTTMKKYVEQYVQSCPYGRVILLGYSSVSGSSLESSCFARDAVSLRGRGSHDVVLTGLEGSDGCYEHSLWHIYERLDANKGTSTLFPEEQYVYKLALNDVLLTHYSHRNRSLW